MRKAGIVGIIVAVLIVALLVIWAMFDVNDYRTRIQAELESRLGRPVTLGQMELGLFPPTFQVDKLSISDDPGFANPHPFVQAEQLLVSVKALPLLSGSLEITSLTLRRPVVELIKNREGVWNFSSLGAQARSSSQPAEPSSGGSFSLASLLVEDGQLALTNRESQKPRAVYGPIDATLEDLAPGKQFSVEIAVRLPGKGTQEVQLRGTGGPIPDGDVAATPFHGTLDLNGVALAGLKQFLNEPALADTDGMVTGKTRIDIESGTAGAEGGIDIQNARVRGLDIGYPLASQYKVSHDLKTDLLTISNASLKLGSTPISVNGTIETKSSPAQLNLKVKADNLSLKEAGRLASAFGVALSRSTTVNGRVNADIEVRGTADRPVLKGTVSAREVQLSGTDIPQPVHVQSVNFALTPAEIRSDDFDIRSGETTVKSNIVLRQYDSDAPTVNALLRAPNAQLPALLSIAKAYGVKALDNINGSGALNLDMRLSGPVQSLDGDAILRALNGDTQVNFSQVRVTGTNLSQEISRVAGFLKPPAATGQRFTDVSSVTGTVTVKNGIARTSDLKAKLNVGTIAVSGAADLVGQVLSLHVNAVVAPGVSRTVGGTGISGYMKTALANNQGELVIPVLVSGTFQDPKVTPDLQSFARMRLKGLLPSSSNPAAGLSGLVGDLLAKKGGREEQGKPQTGQQPKSSTQETLQQILESLSGKKKQQDSEPKPQK